MNNNIINNNMQIPGMMYNKDLLKEFQIGFETLSTGPKMHVIFKTTQGVNTDLFVDYDTTIDKLLEKYLKTVNRPDLIGDKNILRKICFLFNAYQLKFGDQTPVKNFFKGIQNPKVVVNDVNGLING